MANYRLTSGIFEGEIVADDTQVLDIPFADLDGDIQDAIIEFAESQIGEMYTLINNRRDFAYAVGNLEQLSGDELKSDYEFSWDYEETDDEPTLKPFSVETREFVY